MNISLFNVRQTAPYGLALLRIALGIAFLLHGWAKLSGGIDGVAGVGGFFGGLGIPAPGLMAWIVTIVEVVGGILLIVGFLTQIAGILLALDMLGVIIFAYFGQGTPFIDRGVISWEMELVFGIGALCIALAGPGAWAVDDMLGESRASA
jgi:putative oxidoreductase